MGIVVHRFATIMTFFIAIILAIVGPAGPTPGWGQDPADQFLVETLIEEARQDRAYAEEMRDRARKWRDLAEQARRFARESRDSKDREGWERDAAEREARAADLERQAARAIERAKEKEAQATGHDLELQPETDEPAATAEDNQEPTRHRMSLEQTLGVWRHSDDFSPFVILPEDPDFAAYPNRLEAHTNDRIWKGNYTSFDEGDVGRPQEGRLVFTLKPKAEEINPAVPLWARKTIEGKLEWKVILDEGGTCGSPRLKGKWFPGEISWGKDAEGKENSAWLSGDGEPREISLVPSDDLRFDSFSRPVLLVRLPNKYDPRGHFITSLVKRQLFFVEVALPPELAEEEGEALEVEIGGTAGSDHTTLVLRAGAVRKGRSVPYSHEDPVAIADSADVRINDLEPPPLSLSWLAGDRGARLDLAVENGEVVEFRYGEAVESIPVYNSWVQRELVRHAEELHRLRAIFAGVLASPKYGPVQMEEAQKRLQLIKNVDAILGSKKLNDLYRYRIGKIYFDKVPGAPSVLDGQSVGLILLPTDAWEQAASRSQGPFQHPLTAPLSDFERDGSNHGSGYHDGVVWTSRYEMVKVHNALSKGRDDLIQEAYDELPLATALGLYEGLMLVTQAGDFYMAFAKHDIFGKPVSRDQQILAALRLGFGNLLIVSGTKYMASLATSRGRIARLGARVRVQEHVQAASRRPLPRELPKSALDRMQRISQSETGASTKPMPCARAAQSKPPRTPPSSPDFDIGALRTELDLIRAWWGKNHKLVGPQIREPQGFGNCNERAFSYLAKELAKIELSYLKAHQILTRVSENVKAKAQLSAKTGRREVHPLYEGYNNLQIQRLAEYLDAKAQSLNPHQTGGRHLTMEEMDALIKNGWGIKTTMKFPSEKYFHAVAIHKLVRNSKGYITDVRVFDPAFGRLIEVPVCDFVARLAPVKSGFTTQIFSWR